MAKQHIVCRRDDIPVGGRKIVKVGSRSIGVFNVDGEFYALLNICPHRGADLCEGPLGGTNLPVDDYRFDYAHEGKILRCSRHGWEFDVRTGESLSDPDARAKTYPVAVQDDNIIVTV